MTNDDKPRLARVLALLSEAFSEPVTELRAEAYFVALEDLPIESIERCGRAALNCQYFPRPHDLRALVCGKSEDRAELAWGQVVALIRRVGSYGYPAAFDEDKALADAVEACGGWKQLCSTECDQLAFAAANFKRAYGALERRDQIDRGLPAWTEQRLIEAGQ